MTKKLAILGSNGVIGKFLSRVLESYSVTAINRLQLDLLNFHQVTDYFNNNYYDVVINCAASVDSNIGAPLSVASNNLSMFSNIYHVRHKFGRLIQLCSGAAFDRARSINCAKEEDIFLCNPCDAYGLSKNITSRICLTTDNFYTIRLFGVFYHTENKHRLLPKIISGQPLIIQNRYFDYFYLEDLIPVINYYINAVNPTHKDINLVYPEKILLSKFVRLFCEIHNINQSHIEIVDQNIVDTHNYTGSAEKYCNLNLPNIGIESGMKKYK